MFDFAWNTMHTYYKLLTPTSFPAPTLCTCINIKAWSSSFLPFHLLFHPVPALLTVPFDMVLMLEVVTSTYLYLAD